MATAEQQKYDIVDAALAAANMSAYEGTSREQLDELGLDGDAFGLVAAALFEDTFGDPSQYEDQARQMAAKAFTMGTLFALTLGAVTTEDEDAEDEEGED